MTTSSHTFPHMESNFGPAFTHPTTAHSRLKIPSPPRLVSQSESTSRLPPKLPSLEGLLKNMQSEGQTHPRPYQEPHASFPSPDSSSPMPSLLALSNHSSPTMSLPSTPLVCRNPYQSPWSAATPNEAQTKYENQFDPSSRKRSEPMHVSAPVRSTKQNRPAGNRTRASKYCKVDGCQRVSQRNNLCHSHGGKRLCKEDGCSSKDRGNGYCIKHGGGKFCASRGCMKKARRKGLCTQCFRVTEAAQEDAHEWAY